MTQTIKNTKSTCERKGNKRRTNREITNTKQTVLPERQKQKHQHRVDNTKNNTANVADNKTCHHYTNVRQIRLNVTLATDWDTLQKYASAEQKTQKQRIKYLEKKYDDEKESVIEGIQQIIQFNRVLPDENDSYGLKLKINGNYQILPSTPALLSR